VLQPIVAEPADLANASETELVQRAQTGDHDAFAELQSRLDSPIRRFVWRLIGTHPEEDDIVQDSLIALYLNLDRIDPPENLRPYLFRIIRNRCYDLLRKRRRFEHVSLDEEPVESWVSLNEPPLTGSQPEEVTHWLLLNLEVQTAMERLPELQRETLILYSEENMSYNEIAEAMDCSIGTVKSRLFYAKKMLRQLISPETLTLLESEFGTGEPE
jgi:RNA polymerase sigma-70 factor (ECF subfamily)